MIDPGDPRRRLPPGRGRRARPVQGLLLLGDEDLDRHRAALRVHREPAVRASERREDRPGRGRGVRALLAPGQACVGRSSTWPPASSGRRTAACRARTVGRRSVPPAPISTRPTPGSSSPPGSSAAKASRATVDSHPRLFVTLTAPGFGAVHTIGQLGDADEAEPACPHGRPSWRSRPPSRRRRLGRPSARSASTTRLRSSGTPTSPGSGTAPSSGFASRWRPPGPTSEGNEAVAADQLL